MAYAFGQRSSVAVCIKHSKAPQGVSWTTFQPTVNSSAKEASEKYEFPPTPSAVLTIGLRAHSIITMWIYPDAMMEYRCGIRIICMLGWLVLAKPETSTS